MQAILLTHGHIDRISGVQAARAAFGAAPILLHPADRFLYDAVVQQGLMFGVSVTSQPPPDGTLASGHELEVGRLRLRVHETRGAFAGRRDVRGSRCPERSNRSSLRATRCLRDEFGGRTCRAGITTLIRSIRTVLFTFSDEVAVYPGHYDATTIGTERRTNPFLA